VLRSIAQWPEPLSLHEEDVREAAARALAELERISAGGSDGTGEGT